MEGLLRKFSNNQCEIKDIELTLSSITKDKIYAVNSVSVQYVYVDQKRTEEVEAIIYNVTDPKTFTPLRIKSLSKAPVIKNEDLEGADTPVYVEVPVEETVIRPYRIQYGKVSVSIVCPYVMLAKQGK